MNTFWVHKNWKWKKENATAKYIDEHCEEAVTLTDAQATVEALQRERDEANLYRDQARANQESLAACVDRDVRKIKDLQAALDAERERYELLNVERNAIDDKRHVLQEQLANTIEAAAQQECELAEIQALAANLKSQLSQLQALVRALVGTKSFTINGPDIRTMSGNVLYACSSQTSAERLGALLEYRERTLDATTPAHEQTKATVFNEWGGALRQMADVEPKGGDGE